MIEHNVYEVGIQVSGDDQFFQVEHRFPRLPGTEILVALKAEATAMFEALFDVPADEVGVHVIYLGADERGEGDRETASTT